MKGRDLSVSPDAVLQLYAHLPQPPSLNRLYEPGQAGTGPAKRTFLRKRTEVRNYIKACKKLLTHWAVAAKTFPRWRTYRLDLVLALEKDEILVRSWPDSKTRFRSIDASNHVKVAEDVIRDMLGEGVDDTHNFDTHVLKRIARRSDVAGLHCWLSVIDLDWTLNTEPPSWLFFPNE